MRVKGLTEAQRERNLALLRFIASTCAEHAVDFTLGIWEAKARSGSKSPVEGLNAEDLARYSYAALKLLLAECRAIRCVQVRGGSQGRADSNGKNVFRAVAEAGRRVVVEVDSEAYEAASASGAPVRLPLDYWSLWVGHENAAAGRRPGGNLDLLERPRRHGVFWEIGAPGVCSQFAWGDSEALRRMIPALTASGSEGFEIDLGRARPGAGDWLPHFMWGRLGYDPQTPEKPWTVAGAPEAYRQAVQPLARRKPVETAARASAEPLPRPEIEHDPPKEAKPDRRLKLSVRVKPATNVALIRLHYGPASLREPLKTIEIPTAKANFTIPAADLSARWDLMYYFEVLNTEKGTWLDPDPFLAAPYYVVRVKEAK